VFGAFGGELRDDQVAVFVHHLLAETFHLSFPDPHPTHRPVFLQVLDQGVRDFVGLVRCGEENRELVVLQVYVVRDAFVGGPQEEQVVALVDEFEVVAKPVDESCPVVVGDRADQTEFVVQFPKIDL